MVELRGPDLPADRLAGWTLVERTTETLFSLPTAQVIGHTELYEDADLRAILRDVVGTDQPWRFFFATGLTFRPPLTPGIGPASAFPSVLSEATRAFARRLEDRGIRNVERGRLERARTERGDRIQLRRFTGALGLENRDPVDVEGWLGVWTRRGEFRIAGGAYPTRGLEALLDEATAVATDPREFRDELLDLIRAVE